MLESLGVNDVETIVHLKIATTSSIDRLLSRGTSGLLELKKVINTGQFGEVIIKKQATLPKETKPLRCSRDIHIELRAIFVIREIFP